MVKQTKKEEPNFLVVNITNEYLHSLDHESDFILNQLGSPSIRSHISDIFQDSGLMYKGYIFKAQAIGSAFTLNISMIRKRGNPYSLFLSVKDLLDKVWLKNDKVPLLIQGALDIVYEMLVSPHIEDFNRVLSGRKTVTPIKFMQFTRGRIVKANPVSVVFCDTFRRNMSVLYCKEVCPNFDHVDQSDQVFCKQITEIK